MGLFASSDPFLATDLPELLPDGSSESDADDDAVEPIDEQEIYGKACWLLFFALLPFAFLFSPTQPRTQKRNPRRLQRH